MALALALIGYGEVGQLFAREFVARDAAVVVYDIKCDDPVRARAAGRVRRPRTRCSSPAARQRAIRGADIVLSAVTADQAVAAARAAAGHLRPGPDLCRPQFRLADAPSAPWRTALGGVGFRRVRGDVAGRRARASPRRSSPAARRRRTVAERLNPLGMKIEVVSREIGVASATKLCRSHRHQGAGGDHGRSQPRRARSAGVMEGVLKSLAASYPGMDWEEVARPMPDRVARHGVRRAAEMREAARMLEEIGPFRRFRRSDRRRGTKPTPPRRESLRMHGTGSARARRPGHRRLEGHRPRLRQARLLAEGARVAIASRDAREYRRGAGANFPAPSGVAADFADAAAALAAIDEVERQARADRRSGQLRGRGQAHAGRRADAGRLAGGDGREVLHLCQRVRSARRSAWRRAGAASSSMSSAWAARSPRRPICRAAPPMRR